LLLLVLDATAAILKVNSRNFTSEPTQRRRITLSLAEAGPVTASPWLIAGDHVAQFTDTNGVTYFSNVLAAAYRLDIAGSPSRSFPISVFDTNGILDASLLVNSTNYNTSYYTAAQVDALIDGIDSGTSGLTNGQTSAVTFNGGFFSTSSAEFGGNITPTNTGYPGHVLNSRTTAERETWDETQVQGAVFFNNDSNRVQVAINSTEWKTLATFDDLGAAGLSEAEVIELIEETPIPAANITGTLTNGVYVTLRQFGAAADAHPWNGSGTDDSAAFAAAVAAKPVDHAGQWVIDGEGLNYKLDAGVITVDTNAVTLQNFGLVITNITAKNWVTLRGQKNIMRDVFMLGPGTNAANGWQVAAGSVGITIDSSLLPGYDDGNHAQSHPLIERVTIWSFATNIAVLQAEHGKITDCSINNARFSNLHIGHADAFQVDECHIGSWYAGDGFDAPYLFFPTNSSDLWLSNSDAVVITGPFDNVSLKNTSAGGGRSSVRAANGFNLMIDGMHIENMHMYDAVRALISCSNVTGVNIQNLFTVKPNIPFETPQGFGVALFDCASQHVFIDGYGPWGTSPFVAAYFQTNGGGGYVHPGVSEAANRQIPKITRGGFSYRELYNNRGGLNLSDMTGTDTVLPYGGTSASTGNRQTFYNGIILTNADSLISYTGPEIWQHNRSDGMDQVLGADVGANTLTGDHMNFNVVGRGPGNTRAAIYKYQAYAPEGMARLDIGGNGIGWPSLSAIQFSTATSTVTNAGGAGWYWPSGGAVRWTIEQDGDFWPTTTHDIGKTANRVGVVYAITFDGSGSGLTNVPLAAILSPTNTWGSQSIDFAIPEASTNASGPITFALAVLNLKPTGYNYATRHINANGANRTVTIPTGWSSTRTTHIITNGTRATFTVVCQLNQFTNISQVDYVPAP